MRTRSGVTLRWWRRRGILPLLVAGLLAAPAAAQTGQDSHRQVPAESAPESGGGHGVGGAVIGAGAGFALGLGVASLTDYALEEGGLFTVLMAGGAIGAFVGAKLGASLGTGWSEPGRLQVSIGYAGTISGASSDIEAAFRELGLSAENQHHGIAPSVAAAYGLGGHVGLGVELSGLPGQWFHVSDGLVATSEQVGGRSIGSFASYRPPPGERRRFVYSVGVGIDRYTVDVLSYMDPQTVDVLHEDQPNRSSSLRQNLWGGQLRGGLEYYLVDDVSVTLGGVVRLTGTVDAPGIELRDSGGQPIRTLPAHGIDLSSLHLQLGVGMRFL